MTRGYKRVVGLLCATLVVVGAYVPTSHTTPRAHALFGVGDTVIIVGDIPRELHSIADALAWTVAKTVVQSMTQSIVNWINSGFEGSPAFVSDLNRNLGSLADAVAEDFLDGLDQTLIDNTGFSIRAPFQDQISAALREEFYRTTSSYGFNARYPYTDCYQGGDFSFTGFFCESQNPANNVYGRYELASNELWSSINKETQNRLREIDWGNGFLSWRGSCRSTSSNSLGSGLADLSGRDATVGCPIRTPGTVIEDQLVQSLGSPMRQLELADSVNEIVAALMTQMVNQVLGGGGLSGVSQPSSGGGSSYLDRATDTSTSLGSGFLQTLSQERNNIGEYQIAWQKIASAASAAQLACTGDSRQSEATSVLNIANNHINDAVTILGGLATVEEQARALQTRSSSDSTAVVNIVNDYNSLLSQTGQLAQGVGESSSQPGTLYTQMTELEASCR